jgi:Flp pilus assembly protein TadG
MSERALQTFLGSTSAASARDFAVDTRGSTAIEFALVATPFLMMIFGVINTGMYYYSVNSLDRGIEDASRAVRTGEAQKAGKTVGDFKTLVCNAASGYVDCSKVEILLQSVPEWQNLTPQACQSAGVLTTGTGTGTDLLQSYTGTQNQVVLVTACYKWETAKYLPFFKLGNLGDGSMLIQSSTAFRTEPYL